MKLNLQVFSGSHRMEILFPLIEVSDNAALSHWRHLVFLWEELHEEKANTKEVIAKS